MKNCWFENWFSIKIYYYFSFYENFYFLIIIFLKANRFLINCWWNQINLVGFKEFLDIYREIKIHYKNCKIVACINKSFKITKSITTELSIVIRIIRTMNIFGFQQNQETTKIRKCFSFVLSATAIYAKNHLFVHKWFRIVSNFKVRRSIKKNCEKLRNFNFFLCVEIFKRKM
jgi:hypothetical protein